MDRQEGNRAGWRDGRLTRIVGTVRVCLQRRRAMTRKIAQLLSVCCLIASVIVFQPGGASANGNHPHTVCTPSASSPQLVTGGFVRATGSVICNSEYVVSSRLTNSLCRSRWYGCQVRATGDTGYESLFSYQAAETLFVYCGGTTHNWRHRLFQEVSLAGHPNFTGESYSGYPRLAC